MIRSGRVGGFTLIEFLVAGAVLTILLSVITVIFVQTTKAYDTNSDVSDRQQRAEAAIQMLTYDLNLVGYRSTENYTGTTFGGADTLVITTGTSDQIQVRYFEDGAREFAGSSSATLVNVTFSIDAANDVLVRNAGANSTVADGVTGLKVLSYINDGGATITAAEAANDSTDLAAIELRLTLSDGTTRDFIVGFENRPDVTIN